MNKINTQLVDKYQSIYESDPNSQVFAPLAEAYAQMGLLNEAEQLCKHGIKKHPMFSGGHLAYAKVLLQQKKQEEAFDQLKLAADLAPENIAAQRLLAQTSLELKRTKEALKAFKMILFLNPQNETAQKAVQKLESLTADEYEEEVFIMEKTHSLDSPPPTTEKFESRLDSLKDAAKKVSETPMEASSDFERKLSLADAFLARFETEKAKNILNALQNEIGPRKEITKRLLLINQSQTNTDSSEIEEIEPLMNREKFVRDYKIKLLEELLQRVTAHPQL